MKLLSTHRFLLFLPILLFLFHARASQAQTRRGFEFSDPPRRQIEMTRDERSSISEFQWGSWLVKARCTEGAASLTSSSQWRIDHIFSGPQTLQDQTFTLTPQPKQVPPGFKMVAGQEALWVVTQEKESKKIVLPNFYGFGGNTALWSYNIAVPLVSRPVSPLPPMSYGITNYSQALIQAQFVERLAHRPPDKQIGLLKEYALSAPTQQSCWAIRALGDTHSKDVSPFLYELARTPHLKVEQLLAIDSALSVVEFSSSPYTPRPDAYLALWRRILTSSAHESVQFDIVSRLSSLASSEYSEHEYTLINTKKDITIIGGQRLFEWLRLAAANSNWTATSRARAINSVGYLSINALIPRASAWSYLMQQLVAHPDFSSPLQKPASAQQNALQATLAIAAVRELRNLKPFTTKEEEALHALQAGVKSPDLRAAFEEMFKASPDLSEKRRWMLRNIY